MFACMQLRVSTVHHEWAVLQGFGMPKLCVLSQTNEQADAQLLDQNCQLPAGIVQGNLLLFICRKVKTV